MADEAGSEAGTTSQSTLGMTNLTAGIQKLNGKNFLPWLRQIKIALKIYGLYETIENDMVDTMKDMQATLILLGAMDDSHKLQVQSERSAKKIVDGLARQYCSASAASKHKALSNYLTCKKSPTDTMSEHIAKVKEMRAALAEIGDTHSDDVFQVTLINSLPEEYGDFMEIWDMTHSSMKTNEFLCERLTRREEEIKKKSDINPLAMMVNSSNKPWHLMSVEEKKKISKCGNCQKIGHWKRECTLPMKDDINNKRRFTDSGDKKREANSFFTSTGEESNETDESRSLIAFNMGESNELKEAWILDSGATHHMANNPLYFSKLEWFLEPKHVKVGDGTKAEILGIGVVKVLARVNDKVTQPAFLRGVYFIPSLTTNLMSISALPKELGVSFDNELAVVTRNFKNKTQIVARGKLNKDKLYVMDMEVIMSEEKGMFVKTEASLGDWHRILGHPGKERLIKALKGLGIRPKESKSEFVCEICPAGKGERASHPSSTNPKAEEAGMKVHVDIAYVGNKVSPFIYYLLCKDEATEFTKIYSMTSKNETVLKLAKFLIEFQEESGKPVRRIMSDNGTEFKNKKTELLFLKERVVHDTSAPYSPQQNGTIEREVKTIKGIARTLMLQTDLGPEVIPEALETAAFLKNCLPTKRSTVSPFERYTGRVPFVEHLVQFGTPVQVYRKGEYLTAIEPRTENGYVVGFTLNRNYYKVYLPKLKRVIVTCEVFFAPHRKTNTSESSQGKRYNSVELMIPLDHEQLSGDKRNIRQEQPSIFSQNERFTTAVEKRLTSTPTQSESIQSERAVTRRNDVRKLCTGEELEEFFNSFRRRDRNESEENLEEMSEIVREGEGPPELSSHDYEENRNQSEENLEEIIEIGREGNDPPELLSHDYEENEDQFRSSTDGGSAVGEPPTLPPADYSLVASMGTGVLNEPRNYQEAISSMNKREWQEAIKQELQAHQINSTWKVVDRPKTGTTLSAKWVFVIKRDACGRIDKFKARLVARGFQQTHGIDYFDTFSPVAKLESLRVLLAVAARDNLVHTQFDITTAFLHGKIKEDIYLEPPEGIQLSADKCLKLEKALYGLKQAPRAWSETLDRTLDTLGFIRTNSDSCVYLNQKGTIILIYVDDGLVISRRKEENEILIKQLSKHFRLKILSGESFLGINITRHKGMITLSQANYVDGLVEKFNLKEARSVTTPICNTKELLTIRETDEPTQVPYREIIGCLLYIGNCTRPDILFATNILSRCQNNPMKKHWEAAKRVVRYLKQTRDYMIIYEFANPLIEAFSDADYANDPDERKSISGVMIKLAGGPIVFRSHKQRSIAQSSTEAEYIAANSTVKEIKWLTQFLDELQIAYGSPTLKIDNLSTIKQIENSDNKGKSKHIEVKYHYIRDQYKHNLFKIQPVESSEQLADLLTKGLSGPQLARLSKLSGLKTGTQGLQTNMAKISDHREKRKMSSIHWWTMITMFTMATIAWADNFRFESTETQMWMTTNYKVTTGLNEFHIFYKMNSPCEINRRRYNFETQSVGEEIFKGLERKCTEGWNSIMIPAAKRFAGCLANSRRRKKREVRKPRMVIDPISLGIGITLVMVFCVSWGYTSYRRAYSADSDLQRINKLEENHDKVRMEIAKIERDAKSSQDLRDDIISQVERNSKGVSKNANDIKQIREVLPDVSWITTEIHKFIHDLASSFERMMEACEIGELSTKDTMQLMSMNELKDIDNSDTNLLEVNRKDETIIVKALVPKISNDSSIFKVATFNYWTDMEDNPKFMIYEGPEFVMINRTANCTVGLNKPERINQYNCSVPNLIESRLKLWKTVDESIKGFEDMTKPTVIRTKTHNHIYCMYHQIRIGTISLDCPHYPFKLASNIPFSLPNFEHNVTVKEFAYSSIKPIITVPRINLTTVDEFAQEASLFRKLREKKPENHYCRNVHVRQKHTSNTY